MKTEPHEYVMISAVGPILRLLSIKGQKPSFIIFFLNKRMLYCILGDIII